MLKKSSFFNQKGQALVETVLLLPLLCIIIMMIVWTSRILLTKQQLLMAARYGTDMIVYTKMNKQQIEKEMKNYLTHRLIKGRILNREKLRTKIYISYNGERFPQVTGNPLDAILKIDDIISEYVKCESSWVELYYDFSTPKIFKAFKGYIPGGDNIPENLTVSARSEVVAGTGCKKPG